MKSLLFSLVAALLLSACSYNHHEVAPTTNHPTKSIISTLAQQPYAVHAFNGLQYKYPTTAGQRQAARPGWASTPWGLADTTHVLTLQQPGGRPFYTFNLQAATASSNRQKLLLYPYAQGSKGLLLTYASDADWNGRPPFQGTLTIQDLEQRVISVIHMAGGVATPVAAKQGTANRGIFTGSLEPESCLTDANLIEVCNNGEESTATGIELPEELQECYQTIELVYETCNANTVGAPGISQGILPGTPLPSGGGSGSGSSGPGTTTPLPPEEPTEPILTGDVLDLNDLALDIWVEEQIDTNQLDECFNNVLQDLLNVEGGVADLLKFFGPESASNYFNWELVSADTLPGSSLALTSAVENNQGIIIAQTTFFREFFTNASDLMVAATVLHECIHAFLTMKMAYDTKETDKEYPELFNDFFDSDKNLNYATHNEMIRSFIGELTVALKAYGDSKGYDDIPNTYYEALAWGGLIHMEEFALLDVNEQNTIMAVQAIELNFQGVPAVAQMQKGELTNCN